MPRTSRCSRRASAAGAIAAWAAVLGACSTGGSGVSSPSGPGDTGAGGGAIADSGSAVDVGADAGVSADAGRDADGGAITDGGNVADGGAGGAANCREGASRCETGAVQECIAGGVWGAPEPCANRCVATAIGATCSPVADDHTEVLSGSLSYEALVPNDQHTAWTPLPVTFPARGMLVVSRMPDPARPGAVSVIDAAYTGDGDDDAGTFQVRVRRASERDARDDLLLLTVADDGAGGMGYALADPLLDGEYRARDITAPAAWDWSAPIGVGARADLVIGVDDGGAAAHVFSWLHVAEKYARGHFGRRGHSLLVLFGIGSWHVCGPCFFSAPMKALGTTFDRVITFPGNPTYQPYWSESLFVHEVGHWALDSYGTLPQEGGTTWFQQHPTFPGQAWNEGWAQFFSHDVRRDPLSFTKSETALYWLDLDQRIYYEGDHERTGFVWHRASPGDGLLQEMDPNEVASMLWRLSQRGAASERLYRAIAAPHMNTNPFPRGCTRHTWDWGGPNGETMTNVQDTGESLPCLPDFLDTLICSGFSRAELDAVTEPVAYYPYPSAQPICP